MKFKGTAAPVQVLPKEVWLERKKIGELPVFFLFSFMFPVFNLVFKEIERKCLKHVETWAGEGRRRFPWFLLARDPVGNATIGSPLLFEVFPSVPAIL